MATPAPTGMRPIAEMGTRTKVIVMAGTMLGMFTAAMDQTVVGTSMPKIIGDLGGFGLYSWVGTGFMLASTATVPVVGKLTDIYGRKPFYMAGIFLLLLGSALCGSSQNVEQLIAFRVVQGLGAGMIMGIAFAILGDVFTPAERPRWIGLMSGVFASASVLGPLIGGTLTDHVHWRWVFYVNLPLGAIALAVLLAGMPNIKPATRPRLDYRGIVLLLATVVPMLLAFSWAGSRYDWLSPQVVGFFAWAGGGLIIFTYAELRTEEPLLPMSLFRNRVFAVSGLVTLITGQRYKMLGVIGLAVMAGGGFILANMNAHSSSTDATLGMIVLGIGLGTSMPLFMLAVQNAVPYRLMGVSTSTMQFLRLVGGTMGVAIMFSLIRSQYSDGLASNVPSAVRDQPQIQQALHDPQFLVDGQALQRVQTAFSAFGAQGQALFAQTIEGVKASLATAIADAFLVAAFVLAVSVVIALFMKEIPLRKGHYAPEEADGFAPALEPAPSAAGALPALPPVAGGANGEPVTAPHASASRVFPLAILTTAIGLAAFVVLRAARRS